MSRLEAFFGRLGSKRAIVDKILKLIPPHKIYVEPFVGGGSVFFAKEPSEKEYLNDIDEELIKGYKLLKKAPKKETLLKHAIKPDSSFKESRDERYSPKTIQEIQEFVDKNYKDNARKLLKILYLSRNTFSFIGKGKIYKADKYLNKLQRIDEYGERLKNTYLSSKDYKDIINRTDSKNTFFYLDPPYEESDGLYKNAEVELKEMRDILKNIKGKFLLSLNDSRTVRNIFKDFKIKGMTVKNVSNSDIGSKSRKEVLIMNY